MNIKTTKGNRNHTRHVYVRDSTSSHRQNREEEKKNTEFFISHWNREKKRILQYFVFSVFHLDIETEAVLTRYCSKPPSGIRWNSSL